MALNNREQSSIRGKTMTDQTGQPEMILACNMNAIKPEDRAPHIALATAVFAAVESVQSLPNGYAFRLPAESPMLLKVAEFVANERLCCPFFRFSLELEPGGPFWLHLTGDSDLVKAFIQAELGDLLNADMALFLVQDLKQRDL
jgi:hypothetical protein